MPAWSFVSDPQPVRPSSPPSRTAMLASGFRGGRHANRAARWQPPPRLACSFLINIGPPKKSAEVANGRIALFQGISHRILDAEPQRSDRILLRFNRHNTVVI